MALPPPGTPPPGAPPPGAPPLCELFTGLAGKAVVATLTGGAFVTYVVAFGVRRALKQDSRSWKVFWLDLFKMGFGQAFAYAINIANSHRNAGTDFDPVSWYFPTFLNDEIIAVPLGVLLWHQLTLRLARVCSRRWPRAVWLQALTASGRYYPVESSMSTLSLSGLSMVGEGVRAPLVAEPEPACLCIGASARRMGRGCDSLFRCTQTEPDVRYDWWLVQLLFWSACVLASRLLGGLVVPLCAHLLADRSPYFLLARWVYELHWSCDSRRWIFAGVLRIVIDILQLAFVDWFNKFRARHSCTRTREPSMHRVS